ncbi:MAG: hypothetical protein MJZ61_03910 [Bacteroidales bacterium]|nr:hypothetical protein [Bacteroidales bacterium]
MSIERILQKEAPQPGTVAGLSGAGLGMAEPSNYHRILATVLNTKIGSYLLTTNKTLIDHIISFPESKSEDAKKDYYKYDVAIQYIPNFRGEDIKNIVAVEIYHNGNIKFAPEKVRRSFIKYPSLEEFFVYNYEKDIWQKFIKKNKSFEEVFSNTSYSNYLRLDLDDLILEFK